MLLFQDDVLCPLWRCYLQKSRQAYTHDPVRSCKFRVVSFYGGAWKLLVSFIYLSIYLSPGSFTFVFNPFSFLFCIFI